MGATRRYSMDDAFGRPDIYPQLLVSNTYANGPYTYMHTYGSYTYVSFD